MHMNKKYALIYNKQFNFATQLPIEVQLIDLQLTCQKKNIIQPEE